MISIFFVKQFSFPLYTENKSQAKITRMIKGTNFTFSTLYLSNLQKSLIHKKSQIKKSDGYEKVRPPCVPVIDDGGYVMGEIPLKTPIPAHYIPYIIYIGLAWGFRN